MDKIEKLLEERSEYGNFCENSIMVQRMKDALRDHNNFKMIPEYEIEAIEMILHKIGRIIGRTERKPLEDSVDDICGYAQLIKGDR